MVYSLFAIIRHLKAKAITYLNHVGQLNAQYLNHVRQLKCLDMTIKIQFVFLVVTENTAYSFIVINTYVLLKWTVPQCSPHKLQKKVVHLISGALCHKPVLERTLVGDVWGPGFPSGLWTCFLAGRCEALPAPPREAREEALVSTCSVRVWTACSRRSLQVKQPLSETHFHHLCAYNTYGRRWHWPCVLVSCFCCEKSPQTQW